MDNVDHYRQLVQALLTEYGQVDFNIPELETELIFDTERDHYQVVHVGFSNKRRVYGCVLHVDIKNGKIWIQHDGTEGGIADELVECGVPKHDIVLGFHSPFKRQFTDFAVG